MSAPKETVFPVPGSILKQHLSSSSITEADVEKAKLEFLQAKKEALRKADARHNTQHNSGEPSLPRQETQTLCGDSKSRQDGSEPEAADASHTSHKSDESKQALENLTLEFHAAIEEYEFPVNVLLMKQFHKDFHPVPNQHEFIYLDPTYNSHQNFYDYCFHFAARNFYRKHTSVILVCPGTLILDSAIDVENLTIIYGDLRMTERSSLKTKSLQLFPGLFQQFLNHERKSVYNILTSIIKTRNQKEEYVERDIFTSTKEEIDILKHLQMLKFIEKEYVKRHYSQFDEFMIRNGTQHTNDTNVRNPDGTLSLKVPKAPTQDDIKIGPKSKYSAQESKERADHGSFIAFSSAAQSFIGPRVFNWDLAYPIISPDVMQCLSQSTPTIVTMSAPKTLIKNPVVFSSRDVIITRPTTKKSHNTDGERSPRCDYCDGPESSSSASSPVSEVVSRYKG